MSNISWSRRRAEDPAVWFWSKVSKSEHGCWLWERSTTLGGYGMVGRRYERETMAHRMSWVLATHKPVPEGMCVLHRCDTPACVRPSHLFLGTHSDNSYDAVAKGRHFTPALKGAANGRSKLCEKDIPIIRARFAAGEMQKDLGKEYGVSQPIISQIVLRKSWKHVP